MKRIFAFSLLLLPLFSFSQSTNFGIGIIIGSPTGVSGKYLLAQHSAIAVNAGWSFWRKVGFHITGDYQYLFPGVVKIEESVVLQSVVPYFAIGGSMRVKTDNDETEFHVGVRIGGGIEFLVRRFGIFLELYPVVNLIPSTDFDFEGGLGCRFYF